MRECWWHLRGVTPHYRRENDVSYTHNGINLRDAMTIARSLGVTVTWIRRTGEVRFEYPGMPPVKQNARRKDATRAVVAFLRSVGNARWSRGGRSTPRLS
jgi:hypothetical protein